MAPASSSDDRRDEDATLAAQIRQLYRASVQQVISLLDGALSNLEDCLFEIAYISDEPDIHKRCFNLMRELRMHQDNLRRGYARLLLRHLDSWYQFGGHYAFPPGREDTDELKAEAARLSARAQSHLSPPIGALESVLTTRIAEWHTASGSVDVETVVFPLAPQSLTLAFLESTRALDLDPGQRALLLQLFRRYVLDRLGSVIPRWSMALATTNVSLPADATDHPTLDGATPAEPDAASTDDATTQASAADPTDSADSPGSPDSSEPDKQAQAPPEVSSDSTRA